MNGTVQNLKEAWQKMPGKTKKMIAVIAAGTIILAAAGLLVLNIGTKKGYSTLFTGMSSDVPDSGFIFKACILIRQQCYRHLLPY